MPIQITCPGCQAKLKAPDTAAGKKIKCPKCQTIASVPATGGNAGTAAKSSAVEATSKSKTRQWFVQTPDGDQYGPVPREELDQWYSEGRVSADCQLLKEGGAQWQWATELYPSLTQTAASAASSSKVSLASTPASSSLLTPISPAGPLASPMGIKPLATPALSPLGSPSYSAATLPSFTTGTAPSAFSPPGGGPLNPYSTPAMSGTYGGYGPRTGPHPMVIVAGIFHILFGVWNVILFILASILAVVLLLAGGTAAAMGANMEEAEAQGFAGGFAAVGVIGAIVAFVTAIVFLAYGIVQFCTSVGLFNRRQWSRVASFVFAGLGILYIFSCLLMIMLSHGGFTWIVGAFAELVYVTILFVAMCMPDATRDFR